MMLRSKGILTLVSLIFMEEAPMIYTPLTIKAMNLAYQAHHGQYDQGGTPYIFHPFHLAEQMTDEFTVCAALLHDVLEDTDVSVKTLEEEFPREVTEAVLLLTHDPSVDYFDYVRALRSNPIARAVKLADLEHNSDLTRLPEDLKENGCASAPWRKKYAKALEILMEE